MLSRRDILKIMASLPAAGLLSTASCQKSLADAPTRPALPLLRPDAKASRVVVARSDQAVDPSGKARRGVLQKLLDRSMTTFTGEKDPTAAWKRIVSPHDLVGIKVNTIASASRGPCTQPALVDAVVAGLRSAGVPAQQIIIWDRKELELIQAGYRIYRGQGGVQCLGTDSLKGVAGGYEGGFGKAPSFTSEISRILTRSTSVFINMPVLKDHSIAGITFGMKNLYGVIDNAPSLHDEVHKAPYIPDLWGLPLIQSKYRLTVGDMTRCMCDGGPFGKGDHGIFHHGGVIVGTDQVAIDSVAARIISQQREKEGLDSLVRAGRPPEYIALAARKGLGRNDSTSIDLRELTL